MCRRRGKGKGPGALDEQNRRKRESPPSPATEGNRLMQEETSTAEIGRKMPALRLGEGKGGTGGIVGHCGPGDGRRGGKEEAPSTRCPREKKKKRKKPPYKGFYHPNQRKKKKKSQPFHRSRQRRRSWGHCSSVRKKKRGPPYAELGGERK